MEVSTLLGCSMAFTRARRQPATSVGDICAPFCSLHRLAVRLPSQRQVARNVGEWSPLLLKLVGSEICFIAAQSVGSWELRSMLDGW